MQFEINLKNISEITQISDYLAEFSINNLCLIDKPKALANLVVAEQLLIRQPNLQLTLNFAVANHLGNYINILQAFENFLFQASILKINDFLIVSGNPSKTTDSVDIFNHITKIGSKSNFYCTYNPYLTGEYLQQENLRFQRKLETGVIHGVYLQIGADQFKLKNAIEYIKSLNTCLLIFGCLLIPNTKVQNSFRFRPWKGIFLSNEYLEDLDIAINITQEILEIYKLYSVTPLVELIPFDKYNLTCFIEK